MPSLAQMAGSLHIHQFYIGKLKAKQEQLFDSDPELAMLLDNVVFCPSTLKSWLATLLIWNAMIDSA
ncbi:MULTISPECIES: hypothetical protein [Rhizobium]|uniref:hypothetical protein n=1 Tax=Rhizobium TaxID=379 RepID=UPI00039E92C3|nr:MULTISPECIES: hypothetical protein [Rhizobium]UWM82452.1 hypothetical protein N2A41_04030 [Rhizobium leguminosarum bv. viciae]